MASYQSRQRDPLLDQRVQAMLERRGRELFGLALIGISFAFALLLLSYSPTDPGWMVSTDQPVNNALGRLGAAIASTLMTVGGMGAWGIPGVLCAWGVRFAAHIGADRAVSRVVFAVIAVALGSIYAATLVPGASWPHSFGLGGLFGDTILASILTITSTSAFAVKLVSLVVALAFAAMFLFVTGFSLRELVRIAGFLAVGLVFAYHGAMQALGKGAQGSVSAASTLGARLAERRAAAAERAESERATRVATRQAAKAAAVGTARMTHAEEDEAPAFAQPEPLTTTRAPQTRALRAEPRAVVEEVEERGSLFSRLPQIIRRAPDPEPELIEPPLSADLPAPSEDRIKARISSVIRARTAEPAVSDLSPISAAIARREPGMTRPAAKPPLPRSPQPLVIKPAVTAAALVATRPAAPVAEPVRRVTEPPLTKRPAAEPADFTDALDDTDSPADWELDAGDTVSEAAIGAEWDEAEPLADMEPDYDPTPVAPKRPALVATRPAAPLVQPVVKKPAPSRQALAEEQPRLRFEDQVASYELPPLSLLTQATAGGRNQLSTEALEENARMLENVLDDYGVRGETTSERPEPVVTT